jgi:2-dehydropantoate 2-reductase
MKVAVIGPGAMGCLFAARMAKAGIQTTLVDYKPDRANRLQESGLTVEGPDETISAQPRVVTRTPTGQDLIFVLTKSHSIEGIQFPPEAPIVTLQNGLSSIDTLCSMMGSARILAGVTSEGATLLGEGRVRHAARGVTSVGSWTSCSTKAVEEALQKADFDVEITEAPGQKMWEKTAVSSAILPLTDLLNVTNGQLLELREARQLMRDIVVEATKVAGTEGYRFNYSLVERAEELCRQTADNVSSMLQDVRAAKKTEIDSICGEILKRALFASLPTPRTRVIWQLVKGLEQR